MVHYTCSDLYTRFVPPTSVMKLVPLVLTISFVCIYLGLNRVFHFSPSVLKYVNVDVSGSPYFIMSQHRPDTGQLRTTVYFMYTVTEYPSSISSSTIGVTFIGKYGMIPQR